MKFLILLSLISFQAQAVTEECSSELVLSVASNKSELSNALVESPLFVDFGATWCSICHIYAPFVRVSAEKYGLIYVYIDYVKTEEIRKACGVHFFPTYMIFNERLWVETFAINKYTPKADQHHILMLK